MPQDETAGHCTGSCQGCTTPGSCPDRVVCRCLKVSETEVIEAITVHGVRTLKELRLITEAGDGCTCCHRELNAYLAIYSPSSSSSPAICSAK